MRSTVTVGTVCAVVALSACSPDRENYSGVIPPANSQFSPKVLTDQFSAVKEFFKQAPVVVVSPASDSRAMTYAASVGAQVGVPMLAISDHNAAQVADAAHAVGAKKLVLIGQSSATDALSGEAKHFTTITIAPGDVGATEKAFGITLKPPHTVPPTAANDKIARLRANQLVITADIDPAKASKMSSNVNSSVLPAHFAHPTSPAIALATAASPLSSVALAKASGAHVLVLAAPDPRLATSANALHQADRAPVLALGSEFGSDDQFASHVNTARTGPQIFGGGQIVFPGRRMVALYGYPGDPGLGVLGEQSAASAVKRVKALAARYQALSDVPVVPAFEIIASVASSSPGSDGQYSSMADPGFLEPWIDQAQRNGVYVLLDLQPGRTDFLTQAKHYEELLKRPNVGLALDPEWRLGPHQVHLAQIGSVAAAEVNQVSDWLSQVTRSNKLPQKVFMLHQFTTFMVRDRASLNTDHPELSFVVHADGHGAPSVKMDTWRALLQHLPPRIHMGWKNFYREDSPTFTPRQTMDVVPTPSFISYQ